MSTPESSDITIVGGGMAGGLLAALLADQGVSITVLDGAPPPAPPNGDADLRVSALTLASQGLLSAAGVWPLMESNRICAYSSMAVWDGDGTGEVAFDAREAGAPSLGWLVENSLVVDALYRRCLDLGVNWQTGRRLTQLHRTDDQWHLTLDDGTSHPVVCLVGADGAGSFVRHHAGIPAPVRETGHVALVANLVSEQAHDHCARQWFLPSGPLAVLPMFGDGHQSSLVWSAWPDEAQRLSGLSDEAFADALTQATGGMLGRITAASERRAFPISNLHASDYVLPGLALVGDAAHVVHPLAGQGINLGLLDAGVLAEEMLVARERGLAMFHERVLARYQRRRRGHNLVMQRSFLALKALFEEPALPVRLLRNTGMRWVNQTPFLKRHLARAALGLHGDVPRLAAGKVA